MEEVSKYLPFHSLLCGVFLLAVLLFYIHLNSDCSWNLFPLLLCAYVCWCLQAPCLEMGSKLVPLIIPWHGLRRKRCFQQFLYCWVLNHCCRDVTQWLQCGPQKTSLPAVPLLLRVGLLPWELVYLRSLPSNGSTRYSMLVWWDMRENVNLKLI